MTGQEQCIKLHVPIVEMNAKCHSSPQKEDRSIVENVIKNVGRQEGNLEDISKQYLISKKSYR